MFKSPSVVAGMNSYQDISYIKIEPHDIIIKYHGYSPNTHTFIYMKSKEIGEYKKRYNNRKIQMEREREREREPNNLENFRWLLDGLTCMKK